MKRLENVQYTYNSLSVPGGGFVTGFVFHPCTPDILYARTDIGGVYRFCFEDGRWQPLCNSFTEFQHHLTQPLSIALDKDRANMLYAMCGDLRKGAAGGRASLLISEDYGETFTEKPVPFCCNGNSPARSTAERLAYKDGKLYFGSQGDGLWLSEDNGDSWKKLGFCEENIVFVCFPENSDIMIVSCSGETNADGNDRAHTLYVSYDFGISFEPLTIPEPLCDARCEHNGFVAVGIACHGKDILISFTHSIKSNPWGGWNDFSCDNGGGFDGRLYRYKISGGKVRFCEDITPIWNGFSDENERRRLPFGLGGVDFSCDTLAVCSVGGHGDAVFISHDNGKSYDVIRSTDIGNVKVDVPYLKPEYNGGRLPLHWTSCLRIDPFRPDYAVINTGTGVFALNDINGVQPYISTHTIGIEETVHMNIYGLPGGKNRVIDLVGDLGGFAFSDLSSPCENSFADENGHRYITCLNADFLHNDPDTFIATARGNWTAHTKGGVILTRDGGDSFMNIGYPMGISPQLDEISELIRHPNTNSGWAAITADGKYILWTLAHKWMQIPCFAAVRYDIGEKTFTKIKIYDLNGCDISDSEHHIKIFSDRSDPERAYGFGENGQLYASFDGGESLRQMSVTGGFPECRMSGIDGFKGGEIRFLHNKSGVCYAALKEHGLWRLEFGEDSVSAMQIADSFVKTVGFGMGESEDIPALYISGVLFSEYGFWRSFDLGESWARINTDTQMFGGIVSMDGDLREKGRVYIASGTRGGLYGDEIHT